MQALVDDQAWAPGGELTLRQLGRVVWWSFTEQGNFLVGQGDGADELAEALSFGPAQILGKHQGDREVVSELKGIGDEPALRRALGRRHDCWGVWVDLGRMLAAGGDLADADLILEPAEARFSALAAHGELGTTALAELFEKVNDGTAVYGSTGRFKTLL